MTASSRTPKRRVLIIVENLPVPFDRRVWQEATTLAQSGYQVSVICPKGWGHERACETIDGIAIYRHPLPFEGKGVAGYLLEYGCALFWQFVLVWRVLVTRGFDVIHACNPPDLIFLVGGFFKLLFRKRFLFDHHDVNPELYEVKFGCRDGFYRVLCALERWTFRTADVSIATNDSFRQVAIARGKMAPEKVFVVRSGPKLSHLGDLPESPDLRAGRRYLVGYVGVMGPQDGLDYLLKAAHAVVRDHGREDVQFVLIGDGPSLSDIKELANKLELQDYVHFTGYLGQREMLAILKTTDVCVSPDEWNAMNDKSTMNKVMEYMALGKAIVQFDLTEGRYSAQEASLYAEHNDPKDMAEKILALIDDPDRRARMGAFGRKRIETALDWKFEAPQLLAAYDALWEDTEVKPRP